ncbi:hypothetical protein [Kitasatospora viridis]|uniref:Uncharacterized protein n=1 Tax=Kitasatospora viridis TaxID=281105 RepID=A0A561UKJ9_9ACTN|nr:hypothetical protein [Kitasatospora viridis]TWF99889.1 hypothetical protein FHX73_113749 [Kitasatospora viridis]
MPKRSKFSIAVATAIAACAIVGAALTGIQHADNSPIADTAWGTAVQSDSTPPAAAVADTGWGV